MSRRSRALAQFGKVLILVPGLGGLLALPLMATYSPLGMSDAEILTALAVMTAVSSAAAGSGGLAMLIGLFGDREGGPDDGRHLPPRLEPQREPAGRAENVIPFPVGSRGRRTVVA